MTSEARRIAIPGTTNLRELGGYPASGGVVATGQVFRSEVITSTPGDVHGSWEPETVELFRALGIRTVIDLRSPREAATAESAWGRATGADVVALPIEEGGEGTDTNYIRQLLDGTLAQFEVADMVRFYCECLDRRGASFGAAVRLLAEPGRLPVLVHCSAGKDRTGLLTALVLEVLGTPRDIVVADYALTGVLRPNRVQAYAPLLEQAGVSAAAARLLFETPPEAMRAALEHLDERYGGAAGYLRQAGGVSAEDLQALRTTLVAPAGH